MGVPMDRQETEKTAAPSESPNGSAPDESDNPEFDRFEGLLRKLTRVPKRELDEKRNGHTT
jgi:hypothetical protein